MRSCGFPQVKNGRLPTRDEVEENWVAQLNAARSRGDIGSVQLRYLAAQRNTVDATYFFKNSATTGGRPNKRKTKTKDDPLPKDKPKRPYRPSMLRTSMEAKIMLKIRRRNSSASSATTTTKRARDDEATGTEEGQDSKKVKTTGESQSQRRNRQRKAKQGKKNEGGTSSSTA